MQLIQRVHWRPDLTRHSPGVESTLLLLQLTYDLAIVRLDHGLHCVEGESAAPVAPDEYVKDVIEVESAAIILTLLARSKIGT